MSTTFSMLCSIQEHFRAERWDAVIALCEQLQQEERLTTRDLDYTQKHILLYARFAQSGYAYTPALQYADTLCQSASIAYGYPSLRFLCAYIMLCGKRQHAPNIVLSAMDYLRELAQSSCLTPLDLEAALENLPLLLAHAAPSFAFLEEMAATQHVAAPPVDVSGFWVENGVLVKYTGGASIVTVPHGVLSIGDGAFSHACQPIEVVILPEGLVTIGKFAFSDAAHDQSGFCSRTLRLVQTPSTLRRIEESAFLQCHKLEEMDTHGVTHIGSDAFKWCGALKKVDLSALVEIGDSVFWSCWSLEEVIGYSIGGELPSQCFRDCGKLHTFSLPETVDALGSMALSGCTQLPALDLSHIKTMAWYAVSDCSLLTHLTLHPDLTVIPSYAFSSCVSLAQITLPTALTDICSKAFENCSSLETISLPDSVATVGERCFSDCTALKQVQLPAQLSEIQEYTFFNCVALTQVELPTALKEIGKGAFEGCLALERITLPPCVELLSASAFKNCKTLASVNLTHVKEIGNGCFTGCKTLSTVQVSRQTKIHPKAFSGLRKLTIEFID